MTDWDGFFTSLLFGTGSYIGMIIIFLASWLLVLKAKETTAIMAPLNLLMMGLYLNNALAWPSVLSALNAFFLIIYTVYKVKQ